MKRINRKDFNVKYFIECYEDSRIKSISVDEWHLENYKSIYLLMKGWRATSYDLIVATSKLSGTVNLFIGKYTGD